MADIYLRSGATGTGTGASWANAYTTLAAAATGSTNADTIWVADDHAESQTTAMTVTLPTSPGLRVLCANTHVTEPPTGLATSATVAIGAGSVALNMSGFAFIYGIGFLGGTNNSASCVVNIANGTVSSGMIFSDCYVQIRTANASGLLSLGQGGGTTNDDVYVDVGNMSVKFGATGQTIALKNGRIMAAGITLDGAGSIPTSLFTPTASTAGSFTCESSDLSGRAFTNLVNAAAATPYDLRFSNCKLPASINVTTGTIPGMGGTMVEMYNCDSADTNYRFAKHSSAGSTVQETTIVMSGGATDGTTAQSLKMATSAAAKFGQVELKSPWMYRKLTTTGSAVTATTEIVHDSQGAGTGGRFQDDEIWLEGYYLGTSGFPLGTKITDCKSSPIAAAADQTDSSATWTTTGLTSPVKQKLSASFTAQEVGEIAFRVVMAKASKTAYINQVVDIT